MQSLHDKEFVPKDYYTEGFYNQEGNGQAYGDDKDGEKASKWTLSTISDILKTGLVLGIGLVPWPVCLVFHLVFNEIIVGQVFYQAVLMMLPWVVNTFVTKVDFPVLYAKELRLVKSQVAVA